MTSPAGRKALIITEDICEDLELWHPKMRLIEEGVEVRVAAPKVQPYRGKNGYPLVPDLTLDDVRTAGYRALIIPGGFAPDKLRRYPPALEIARDFHADARPIAFICHGGRVPISAKVVRGFRVTSVCAIRDDLENAGAEWVDEGCVVDRHMITAQVPKGLPAFCRAPIAAMQER